MAASTLFSQDKKANWKCVKALQAPCTLLLPQTKNTTNICIRVFHKYWQKIFPAEPKPDMCKLWYLLYATTFLNTINNMMAKQ